ncbi:MAG TPA: PEGA domain-containing protein [Kofleriaceae bacterium]|nr:PEGA domain-containing protein [Kofleriaceae bacterium]
MRAALICWFLVVIGVPAHADDKPWAAGVSAENQKAALDLYNEGAKAFGDAEYKDALATYTRALALWDHPAIRYNIAVCLINLDRPVDALDNLEHAMRFGAAPLGPELWRQAQMNQKLLAARVAEIEVTAEPGAVVSLDGKALDRASQRVLTGDHQIVVEKPKYQTETRAIRLNPGDHVTIRIELKPIAVARTLRRRWSRWLPWSVLGGGAVVAAVGVPVLFAASSSFDRYDAEVTASCPHGCIAGTPAAQHVMDLKSHAELQNTTAISLFAVGGAIAATGFVMVILNQPHLVTPVVGSDHVGVALSGRF